MYLPLLHALAMDREKVCREANWPVTKFRPWLIEPRPEWHKKEVEMLAPNVFRFLDEPESAYHLI